MLKRRIASLGLCAALLGGQPGCAHQLSSRDQQLAIFGLMAGLVAGTLVLGALTDDHCKGPATCTQAPHATDVRITPRGDGLH